MALETEAPDKNQASRPVQPCSGWAIGALVCSLFIFCLPLSVFGALLGFKALKEIRLNPGLGGRRLALGGIVVGLVATLVWGAMGVWWHVNIRRPMIAGPINAIQSGQQGDLEGFRDGFTDFLAGGMGGGQASDAEVLAFLSELSSRYGPLIAMRQVRDDRPPPDRYQMESYGIPYEMEFEMGPIKAEGKFVISSPGEGFVGRFQWLAIFDPERGDLVYPESAAPQVAIPSPPPDPDASNADDGN